MNVGPDDQNKAQQKLASSAQPKPKSAGKQGVAFAEPFVLMSQRQKDYVAKFFSRVFHCWDLATKKRGMCFYLRTKRTEPRAGKPRVHLFASAAHIFSAAAQPEIALRDGVRLPAAVAISVPESDLVILQMEDQPALQFLRDMTIVPIGAANSQASSQGEKAFIVGADASAFPGVISKITIMPAGTCTLACIEGKQPLRIFVLDRTANWKYAGSPVINEWGMIVGLFCEPRPDGSAWVLACHNLRGNKGFLRGNKSLLSLLGQSQECCKATSSRDHPQELC